MQGLRHASRCSRGGLRLLRPRTTTTATVNVSDMSACSTSRAYSAETTPFAKQRKSKDERHELVVQFVAKYKASNNGQMPGITVLRKEVGGGYQILKEILQELEKNQDSVGIPGLEVELEKTKEASKKTLIVKTAGKERGKKGAAISNKSEGLAVGTKKDADVLKSEAIVAQGFDAAKPPKQLHADDSAEAKTPTAPSPKDVTCSNVDFSCAPDDADDGSDLAAPAYSTEAQKMPPTRNTRHDPQPTKYLFFLKKSPPSVTEADARRAFEEFGEIVHVEVHKHAKSKSTIVIVHFKTEEGLSAARKKGSAFIKDNITYFCQKRLKGSTFIKDNITYFFQKRFTEQEKNTTASIKQPQNTGASDSSSIAGHLKSDVAVSGCSINKLPVQPGTSSKVGIRCQNESASKDAMHEGNAYHVGRPSSPLTAVVRISSLSQVTNSKLRVACEEIANVIGLEVRRGGIVDVHFNVKDNMEMKSILDRLSNVTLGEGKLKVSPAPRFFCGKNPHSPLQPQDRQHVRQLKSNIFSQLEQHIMKLHHQVQDYRNLIGMKRELRDSFARRQQ